VVAELLEIAIATRNSVDPMEMMSLVLTGALVTATR